MRKHYLLFVGFVMFSISCFSQYRAGEASLGVRVGGTSGVTFKKLFSPRFGFEAVVGNNFEKPNDGIVATALLEKHSPLLGQRFSALAGIGPSYDFSRKGAGISGVLGFDWRILRSPLTVQADWMPGYYFKGEERFRGANGAISVRYIFNRRNLYSE